MAWIDRVVVALVDSDRPATGRRQLVSNSAAALAAALALNSRDLTARKKRRKKKRRHKGKGGGGRNLVCTNGCTSSVCGQTPAGCPILPSDNIWNRSIETMPVHEHSADYVASIGYGTGLHPDFGSGLYQGKPFGIPFVRVPAGQPRVDVNLTGAPDESDPGPYPIPTDAPVENGSCSDGDRHVIVVQEGSCMLYELYDASQQSDGSWRAYSGARFDLNSHDLRPASWTSADAAGLPILPGLVRFEEVAAGEINHALRFTAARTQSTYTWPARHQAGSTSSPNVPPMGQRFRLKSSVNISAYSTTNQIILRALKSYGVILADNGSNWYLSGVPDDR